MKENGLGRTCSTRDGERKFINGMVRKPEEKKSLGNPRRRSGYNIKMNFEVIEWDGLDSCGSE